MSIITRRLGFLSSAVVYAVQPEGSATNIRLAGHNPLAKKLSSKIKKETFEIALEAIEADEIIKITGILMASRIRKDFTKEEIASFPLIDTVPVDSDGVPTRKGYKGVTGIGGNHRPPEWTEVQDGKRTRWVSFFHDMVDDTPYLRDIETVLEDIDNAENKRVGAKSTYLNMGAGERDSMAKKYRKRKVAFHNHFRTGISVIQQEAGLKECFGSAVALSYNEDNKGNIIPGNAPVILQMVKLPKKFDSFSVNSFNNLDFEWAKENRATEGAEDTWNAILKSLSRDDGDEVKVDPNKVTIAKSEQFYSALEAISAWTDSDVNLQIVYRKIDTAKSVDDVAFIIDAIQTATANLTAMYQHTEKKRDQLANLRAAKEGTLKGKHLEKALGNG